MFTLEAKVKYQTRLMDQLQKEVSLMEVEQKQGTIILLKLFLEQAEVPHLFELEKIQTMHE